MKAFHTFFVIASVLGSSALADETQIAKVGKRAPASPLYSQIILTDTFKFDDQAINRKNNIFRNTSSIARVNNDPPQRLQPSGRLEVAKRGGTFLLLDSGTTLQGKLNGTRGTIRAGKIRKNSEKMVNSQIPVELRDIINVTYTAYSCDFSRETEVECTMTIRLTE